MTALLTSLALVLSLPTVALPGDHPEPAHLHEILTGPPALLEVAAEAGSFETLLALVDLAELDEALAAPGPFTVLAPSDAAFAAIPEILRTELLAPHNRDTLRAILTYHVIPGHLDARAALLAGHAETLQGKAVEVGLADGRLRIQGAGVLANDIEASNGLIHVIDAVLLPPGVSLPEPAGRKVIGTYTEQPSAALASQLGLDRAGSLLVTRLVEDGNAKAAGLQRYDIITAIAGGPATDASLKQVKEDVGFGGLVQLQVLRRGEHVNVDVPVGVERH